MATKRVDNAQNQAIQLLQKSVKRIAMRGEIKNVEVTGTFTATTGGLNTPVSLTVNATDEQGRIGNSIHLTSWQMRWTFASLVTGTLVPSVRMLLFRDKQCNATTALSTDVLDNSSGAGLLYSPYNITIPGRFKIYYDKTTSCYPLNTTAIAGVVTAVPFLRYFKFKRKIGANQAAKGSTAVIGNGATNSLFFLIVSDIASAVSITYMSRTYFTDT